MCGIDNEKRDILCSEVWSEAWWLVVAMFIQIVGVQTLDLRMTNKIHQSSIRNNLRECGDVELWMELQTNLREDLQFYNHREGPY